MAGFIGSIKSSAFAVAEKLTPILRESRFKETGVLTPEEFVIAGDHLVHHCPTWNWAAGDASKSKSYLPPDKQFLITKNVPCHRRCRQMEYDSTQERIIEDEMETGASGGGGEEGWVDTHHYASTGALGAISDKISEMNLDKKGKLSEVEKGKRVEEEDEEDDEDGPALDMDDMMAAVEDEDPNAFQEPEPVVPGKAGKEASAEDSNILETRTYTMNITYDKLYQVPRMWLFGYDEKRKHLTVDEMYEDFSEDHAKKTITMEAHPNIPGPPMASIHPCRHAEVMKRLIEQLAENGKDLKVEDYLLIFLKFVQAVIPTIDYDYTRSVSL